jgi:hypothetical protein
MNLKNKTIILTITKIIAISCLTVALSIALYFTSLYFAMQHEIRIHQKSDNNIANNNFASLQCYPAASLELGRPLNGKSTAEFNLNSGDMYIYAHNFNHSGFYNPFSQSTAVHIGNISMLPAYDPRNDIVSNAMEEISISEDKYSKAIKLPSGRYWLWSSNSCDITVYSCDPNGVSDPKPVK